MKVHELVNVLNHFPSTAEVNLAAGVATTEDGKRYSIAGTLESLTPGKQGVTFKEAAPVEPTEPAA